MLLTGQFVALFAFTLLFLVFYGRNGTSKDVRTDAFDCVFLDAVTFGPFLLTFVGAAIFGLRVHDMWGATSGISSGCGRSRAFTRAFQADSQTRFFYAWSVVFFGILLFFMGTNILYPYVAQKTMRIHFPGKALAVYVTDAWHARYHAPLRFAVGDTWEAGNIGYLRAERPHVFIMGDKTISPSIKSGDFDRYGGVVVWCVRHCLGWQENGDSPPAYVHEKFPQAEIQPPILLARQTEAEVPPVNVGWAIIPPKPDTAPPAPQPVVPASP